LLCGLIITYEISLLALSAFHLLSSRRSGLLALTQVFAPYLFLPLLLALPFAVPRNNRTMRVMLALCLLVFLVRFTPRLSAASLPEHNDSVHVSVMNWNVWGGGRQEQIRSLLTSQPANLVAMEEVDWEWIEHDPALTRLYPYRFGVPPPDPVSGMCLLSIYPILERGVPDMPAGLWDVPRMLWARLDIGQGRTMLVVAAHPAPPPIGAGCPPRNCYNAAARDRRIAFIREWIEPSVQRGEPVLLVGDFNVTEREPAYKDLSRGLLDAHRSVGAGLGHTWGPPGLLTEWHLQPLRIDYLFSSPNIIPQAASVDCTPRGSDHCTLFGRFEIK
jgi:endonuclease/exonuclease/phosphatase (EEP) superfamily protein YafD